MPLFVNVHVSNTCVHEPNMCSIPVYMSPSHAYLDIILLHILYVNLYVCVFSLYIRSCLQLV